MALVNIPIDITEVAAEVEACDWLFRVYDLHELGSVPPFNGMKPGPVNFPGSMILRRCVKGRVLCHQGEEGATAFQILSQRDALNVLQALVRGLAAEEKSIRTRLDTIAQEISPVQTMRLSTDENPQIEKGRGRRAEDENLIQLAAETQQLTARSAVLARTNPARRQQLEQEIDQLERMLVAQENQENQENRPLREVARARLFVSTEMKKKGLLHRLIEKLRRPVSRSDGPQVPDYIPIDGPQDLDVNTLSAPMYEGDLFGEMSCMNLAPRSATVYATEGREDEPIYIVEMLRNTLDALRRNADYKKRIDEIYRTRVMETQVRSLPLFRVLTDNDYQWLAVRVELAEFQAGDVIFDEHDSTADCCYVVRTGVVKTSQNLGCLLSRSEILNFETLCRELNSCRTGSAAAQRFWNELAREAQELIQELGKVSTAEESQKARLRRILNQWIRESTIRNSLGQRTEEVVLNADLSQYSSLFQDFQEKSQDWWELEIRIFNRVLLERFCPTGLQKRSSVVTRRRTLSYAGRGEIIGEIGALSGDERTATCLAFTHPLSGQKMAGQANLIPQRVEAVRISADVLRELQARSQVFRELVEETIRKRRENDQIAQRAATLKKEVNQTEEFDALGLAWGQSLMVIDLDRCTRCQECVKACVGAHDDGRTRLYLDGPRFENRYLIPVTCRKCLDPVCMIGCPVGAINRGSTGEIRIADHCIGCSKCADQCPYGSIQMDLLEPSLQVTSSITGLLGPGYMADQVRERAVVCDLCASTPSREPSCVYACPHDAAIRVEGLYHFDQ